MPSQSETLFPVFVFTAVLAVGWTIILCEWGFLTEPEDSLRSILAYGFAGAYLFNLQALIRRFFQRDLRASAYASAFNRIVTVLIVVTVVHQLPFMQPRAQSSRRSHSSLGSFPSSDCRLYAKSRQRRCTPVSRRSRASILSAKSME